MNLRIDIDLVRTLIAQQFPRWADLPVRPVDHDGWDNRTFRLGEQLSVRLPSAPGYVPQVHKEIEWLPVLAGALTLPIPRVVAVGGPGAGYPFDWTVRDWIPGTPIGRSRDLRVDEFARDVALFLTELRSIRTPGPPPGPHSAGRGAPLHQYEPEIAAVLPTLAARVDRHRAERLWRSALDAEFLGPPRWFHGDVAVDNLLGAEGRLSAVIDFGCAGFGDPACDLVIAWTFLGPAERRAFREVLRPDDAEWARGVGWALWKALISLDDPRGAVTARRALAALELCEIAI